MIYSQGMITNETLYKVSNTFLNHRRNNMKIKFMGKFNNDPESLPSDPITAYSNKLIEPDNYKNIMTIFFDSSAICIRSNFLFKNGYI